MFVIKYDFVLTEDIELGSGCVLEFEGGSINGAYTITGNNTGINAGLVKIFNTNITLAGTWHVAEAYPEWFGAKGDGIADDAIAITKSISLGKKVVFSGYYTVSSTITIQDPIDIVSHSNATIMYNGSSNCFVINGPRIRLSGFNLFGGEDAEHITTNSCAIYLGLETPPSARENRFDNLNIHYFDIGTKIHNSWIDTFVNISWRLNNTGIVLEYISNAINFIACDIDANVVRGIVIDTTVMGRNIVFDNCCIEGNHYNVRDTANAVYDQLVFRSCYFEEENDGVSDDTKNNIFEMIGSGITLIDSCYRLDGYRSSFSGNSGVILDHTPEGFYKVEGTQKFYPTSWANINAFLNPYYSGDVINFDKMTLDNGVYHPHTNPTLTVDKDLSSIYLNSLENVWIDINPGFGINLNRPTVIDFLIEDNTTEAQMLDFIFDVGYYDSHSQLTNCGSDRLQKPAANSVKAEFYKGAMSNKRFQFIFHAERLIRNNLKNIGCMYIRPIGVKIKILNIAFI